MNVCEYQAYIDLLRLRHTLAMFILPQPPFPLTPHSVSTPFSCPLSPFYLSTQNKTPVKSEKNKKDH